HATAAATDLRTAQRVLDDQAIDVLVLDLALPDGNGLDLCRRLRASSRPLSILLLTAHGLVAQRVEGLDAGADDFLPKPFALAELRARVRALGRRASIPPARIWT